jgi:hypothetical protein
MTQYLNKFLKNTKKSKKKDTLKHEGSDGE